MKKSLLIKKTDFCIILSIGVGVMSLFNGVVPLQYDNLFYMNAARNIFNLGHYINGFNQIETQWPIFYSLTLVPSFFLNIPAHVWGRLLNIFYFFGGVYAFFKFMKKNDEPKEVIGSVLCLILLNFYCWKSVFLEMPDILLFFYFNIFLLYLRNLKYNWFIPGAISFFAIMTKPTGLLFVASMTLVLLYSFFLKKRINGPILKGFFSSLIGTIVAKLINKEVIKYEITSGYAVNEFWAKVDGGVGNLKIIAGNILKMILDPDIIINKLIFYSNWLISSKVFSSFHFIPLILGIILLIVTTNYFVKEFKSKNDDRNKYCLLLFFIYFILCLAPNIQNRHFILLSPIMTYFFIKTMFYELKFFKPRKLKIFREIILSGILFLNILSISYFMLLGSGKSHFGLKNIFSEKSFYDIEYTSLYKAANNIKIDNESRLFVPENVARFVSYQSGLQVERDLSDSKNIPKKGDIVILKNSESISQFGAKIEDFYIKKVIQ